MKKKLGLAVLALLVVGGIVYGIHVFTSTPAQKGEKAITIVVVDETKGNKKELYKETLHTDAKTLDGLLKETTQLKVKMDDSQYGILIQSILNKQQNMEKGPWWVFDSKNNKVCVEQKMCPSADQVKIKNNDEFQFQWIDSFH